MLHYNIFSSKHHYSCHCLCQSTATTTKKSTCFSFPVVKVGFATTEYTVSEDNEQGGVFLLIASNGRIADPLLIQLTTQDGTAIGNSCCIYELVYTLASLTLLIS